MAPLSKQIKKESPNPVKAVVAGRPRKNLDSRKVVNQGKAIAKQVALASVPKAKRQHRWRPGTVALREIRKFQESTNTLIARAPFRRLVREVAASVKETLRMSQTAVDALQEATEGYVTAVLSDSYLCAVHARRVTLMPKDLQLALKLRGDRR